MRIKTLCFMLLVAVCLLISHNGWTSGKSQKFTIDFSGATLSTVEGNPLQIQGTGVLVSFPGSSGEKNIPLFGNSTMTLIILK